MNYPPVTKGHLNTSCPYNKVGEWMVIHYTGIKDVTIAYGNSLWIELPYKQYDNPQWHLGKNFKLGVHGELLDFIRTLIQIEGFPVEMMIAALTAKIQVLTAKQEG